MIGERITEHLKSFAKRQGIEAIGDVRSSGAMIAFELVKDSDPNKPDPTLASLIVAEAEKRGLILLVCGTRFNVIRILPPLTTPLPILEEAIDIMEASIEAAISQSP